MNKTLDTMKLYKNDDANLSIIKKRKVGIIGYGNQGEAQALNLLDSGINIKVGLRENSKSKSSVHSSGLKTEKIIDLVLWADVISLLIPDQIMGDLYKKEIHPYLKKEQTLLFSHGYNIHYGLIKPPEFVDIIMVAPSGPGKMVREKYKSGSGIPNLIAIHKDYSGKAFDLALSYSCAIGGTRVGAFKSTFKEETETDLFGEQVILCGGIPKLMQSAFNTLVEAGYQPIVSWFVCYYEVKMIVDLFHEKGFNFMNSAISDTAEYGGYSSGEKIFDNNVKEKMKKILKDIQNGTFDKKWKRDAEDGYKELMKMRNEEKNTLINKTTNLIIKQIVD